MGNTTVVSVGWYTMAYCKVCESKFRQQIENDLWEGGSENTYKSVAERYKLTKTQVERHKRDHMTDTVNEARKIIEQKCKEQGINRVLTDIEVLDLIIKQAPNILDKVSPQDVTRAIKLKAEILGDIKEESKVTVEWLNEYQPE